MDCQYLSPICSHSIVGVLPWKEQVNISSYWKPSTASIVLIIRRKLNSVWPARLPPWQVLMPFLLVLSPPAILPLINSCFSLSIGLCLCYFHHLEFLFHLSLPTEVLLIFTLLAQISVLSMKLSLCLRLGKITFYWTKYFSFVIHTYNYKFIYMIIWCLSLNHKLHEDKNYECFVH